MCAESVPVTMTNLPLEPARRNAGKPQVSVCVCTFHRPEGLRRCLLSLLKQEGMAPGTFEIVVVDNDLRASAAALVRGFADSAPMVVRYSVEARGGVGHARNRAVAEARAALIAFIDDDEVAASGWLQGLLSARERYGANVVLGPVLPEPAVVPSPWLARSGLFDRPRFATGAQVHWGNGRTGNVLLERGQALAAGGFHPAFATSGGEDVHLFGLLSRQPQFRMVWCDEAQVVETLPAERVRLAYLLRRSFRGGQTMVRVHAILFGSREYWRWGVRALFGAPLRLLAALLAVATGRPRALNYLCHAAGDLGKITASRRQVASRTYAGLSMRGEP